MQVPPELLGIKAMVHLFRGLGVLVAHKTGINPAALAQISSLHCLSTHKQILSPAPLPPAPRG